MEAEGRTSITSGTMDSVSILDRRPAVVTGLDLSRIELVLIGKIGKRMKLNQLVGYVRKNKMKDDDCERGTEQSSKCEWQGRLILRKSKGFREEHTCMKTLIQQKRQVIRE